MKIHHLSEKNSVLNHFLGEIRDVNIQKDRLRFRRNIERIGEIMAYEISKELQYKNWAIATPLGVKNSNKINDKSESTFDSDHYMSANESTDNDDDDDDDSYENNKEPTNKVVYFCSFLL